MNVFGKGKRAFAALAQMLRKPKWRQGRWSVFVLCIVIAISVLVNVGVEALEREYGWRKDYSFNGYATTGAETRAVADRLEKPVDIYLLYQGGQADQGHLMELLNRYAALSDLIRILPTDIAQNPGIFNRFQGDMDSAMEADTVIVSCEETGRYKLLTYDDFITQGYNIETGAFQIEGIAYEKSLTEALIYVTEDNIPVVGVLQGHGELTMEEIVHLTAFLHSNNYDSREVSLLGGQSLEGIDLLLIASPQRDLSGGELEAIDAFAKRGGSLLAMRDYTDPMALPNYFSLLRNYGVQPLAGIVVAGENDEGSYYGEQIYLLPYLCEMDMTLPLIAGKMDILLMPGASAFETPAEPDKSLTVATVLKSGPNAYVRDAADGYTGIEQQANDRVGEMSLALYAHRMHATGNVSRLFAVGNSTMFTDEYIYQRTFNEPFIMQVMGMLLPQKTVSLDIVASSAFHPGLRAGSQMAGIGLIVAMPLCVLVAAICILLPRRNR